MKASMLLIFIILFLAGCVPTPAQSTASDPFSTPTGLDTTQEQVLTATAPHPPTDEPFTRGEFFLENAELRSLPDQSGLVLLHIQGQLPTSCHQFASAICPSCAKNSPNLIQVTIYSLIETGRSCKGPTAPIEQDLPLGVFTEGIYVVELNGQYVGEFDAVAFDKQVEMVRGTVFLEGVNIVAPVSSNEQAKLIVQGFLPTPCNLFKADVSAPNEKGEIQIDAYSLAPAGKVCTDVVQDFTSEIPLGGLSPGAYSVWVNGEEKGVVVVP